MNLCKILVEKHNFDVNIADNDGQIALYHSEKSGSFDLVTFFVNRAHLNLFKTLINKHDFDVHIADNDGWATLQYFKRNGIYI